MLAARNLINVRAQRRHVLVFTALMVAFLLFGLFCHHPDTVRVSTGHAHAGSSGVEHCWTSIPSIPTLGFILVLLALLTITLTFQGQLRFESPFKPPRAVPGFAANSFVY
jgi:hypothetical protein